MIWLTLLGAATLWMVYSWVCLYRNIRIARQLGFPIKVVPVSSLNLIWVIFGSLILSVIKRIPVLKSTSLAYYGRRDWHFHDKADTHLDVGHTFTIVTPVEIWVYTCDPEAINDVFSRRAEFIRPIEIMQMLAVYGPNVSTVEYKDWQRQRKIVAASFNENTNKYVWRESIQQAEDMLQAWTTNEKQEVQGTAQDTRTLSLDILAAAGFKKSYKFYPSTATEVGTDGAVARDYRHSLKIVMDNSIFMMLAPIRLLAHPLAPRKWKEIAQATLEFKDYMMEMLNKERELLHNKQPGTGHLMTSLVRASEGSENASSGDGPGALSVAEILGNIFVINFAGHDTTANTLAYAIMLLAAHADEQEWISEEITSIVNGTDAADWDYETLFPKLKRCQAILLETLRMYPPIMALPKKTTIEPRTVAFAGKPHIIPPHTFIVPSLLAVQNHPEYWGEDALKWNPKRWIVTNTSDKSTSLQQRLDGEELFKPTPGTYFPWSEGPQYCPGKKFAQVEFVAVMAVLFQSYRVRPVREKGETEEQSRRRALAVCEESEHVLLLRMRDGDSIKLRWEEKATNAVPLKNE